MTAPYSVRVADKLAKLVLEWLAKKEDKGDTEYQIVKVVLESHGTIDQALRAAPTEVVALPDEPGDELTAALEKHRIKPEWHRRGRSLAFRILDTPWQSEPDRRATLVAEVACDIRDAVEASSAWQPIASAPKGADVILTDGTKVSQGGWIDEREHGMTGWWSVDGGGWEPTHWMPLPSPVSPLAPQEKP